MAWVGAGRNIKYPKMWGQVLERVTRKSKKVPGNEKRIKILKI